MTSTGPLPASKLKTSPCGDDVICFCYAITRQDVVDRMEQPDATFDTLISETGVGTACAACRLNLEVLVGEAINFKAHGDAKAASSFLKVPANQRNCGYFVGGAHRKTILRIANPKLPHTKTQVPLATYALSIDVYSGTGTVIVRERVVIEEQADFEFDFSSISGLPSFGWFVADIVPLQSGFVGNVRPQVGILGENWCSTYHTQLVRDASLRRTTMLDVVEGKTDTTFVLINTSRKATNLTVTAEGLDRKFTATHTDIIPAKGALEYDVDAAFPNLPDGALILFAVEADIPIRRYFWTRHDNGSLSMDHFPNTR